MFLMIREIRTGTGGILKRLLRLHGLKKNLWDSQPLQFRLLRLTGCAHYGFKVSAVAGILQAPPLLSNSSKKYLLTF